MNLLRRRPLFILLLALAFLFRLWFGLSSEFWFEDELQIYLIGLKFYATGDFPFFGPDVTPTIQIPGALQGLLVGLPLYIAPIAEAPFVLLNLLSFASLCLLAWYTRRRLPEIPAWIVWTWTLTAPWTLGLSTHVLNPSYVLTGGVLFFVGWMETIPALTRGVILVRIANLMMGCGVLWVMQLHMSWVVLVPFALFSVAVQLRQGGKHSLKDLVWLGVGAALIGSLLVPTYVRYGFSGGTGDTPAVVVFNWTNLRNHLNPVEGVLGRFLSFASFEVARFIGGNTETRLQFLRDNLWIAPVTIFLAIVGLLQPAALIALWFRRHHTHNDWRAVKLLTLGTLLLLYVSFLFSFRAPHSHTFYVTLPVAFIYSFYCWSPYLTRRPWQIFAAIFLACGVLFHTSLALHNRPRRSLYKDRAAVQTAIDRRDYKLLGERRTGARY